MKKMLVFAAATLAVSTAALAQQTEQGGPQTIISTPATEQIKIAPHQEPVMGSAAAEEQLYGWYPNVFRRIDETGLDTNRSDIRIPLSFAPSSTTEFRGIGQLFSPKVIYSFLAGSVYNEGTNYVAKEGSGIDNDQQYIDQFKDAKAFTIDTILVPFFRNPNAGVAEHSAKFVIYNIPKTLNVTADLMGNVYKGNGFSAARSTLTKAWETEITPEGIDTTIAGQFVNFTRIGFDPPLVFGENSTALFMAINDDATAVTQPFQQNDTREFQLMIANEEYRTGINQGQGNDSRANPLDSFKTMGVVMFRQGGQDQMISAWQALQFIDNTTQKIRRALVDASVRFFGSVELGPSSVKYHFGHDATSQGLGTVTPNPVTSNARLPFSLTEVANVTLDLYDMNGRQVKNLVAAQRWIPGNYSVALPIDELENGAYLVRMTANDKSYSMKFTVAR
jgi:hypothetical protein